MHGEGDGLPGLVLDRYADTLVLKLYSTAWLPHLPTLLELISELPLKTVAQSTQVPARSVLRLSRSIASAAAEQGIYDGDTLRGETLSAPMTFQENGLFFEVDPMRGQKTGFFLDQRDNRAAVGDLANGLRVLNVFAYTGGFSLYAARGGALEVTSLDISQPALDGAARNFSLNFSANPTLTLDSTSMRNFNTTVRNTDMKTLPTHHLLKGDAFRVLADLHHQNQRYDLIVIDPPAFAKRASEIDGARDAYARLTQLGLGLLDADGIIVLASCSSRVDSDAFAETVHSAARRAGRSLQEFQRTAHALDHPIRFKEGAYLKCIFARA